MSGSTPSPDRRTDRAVSPVVGAALILAIVVVLAVAVGAMLTGFSDVLDEPQGPSVFETTWHPDSPGPGPGAYFNLTYAGGSALDQEHVLVKDDAGNQVRWSAVWTVDDKDVVEVGDYVHIDGDGSDGDLRPLCEAGQTYYIVVERSDQSTTIVDEFTVPSEPTTLDPDCP